MKNRFVVTAWMLLVEAPGGVFGSQMRSNAPGAVVGTLMSLPAV